MITIQSSNFGISNTIRACVKKGKYCIRDHIHQFSEIAFVLDGEIDVTVDGVRETARAGQIIVIPPFRLHSFETTEYSEIWLSVFSNDYVSDFTGDAHFYFKASSSVVTPSPVVCELLKTRLIDTKENQIVFDSVEYRKIKVALYAVFEEYTRLVSGFEITEKSGSLSIALKVIDYLRSHFKENVTLSGVSRQLGYSPEYVSHCLADVQKINFRYLVNSFRVDHAKNLLLGSDRTVSDIAIECGFSGERSFYRSFLSMVGITPGEYRKRKDKRI